MFDVLFLADCFYLGGFVGLIGCLWCLTVGCFGVVFVLWLYLISGGCGGWFAWCDCWLFWFVC